MTYEKFLATELEKHEGPMYPDEVCEDCHSDDGWEMEDGQWTCSGCKQRQFDRIEKDLDSMVKTAEGLIEFGGKNAMLEAAIVLLNEVVYE